MVPTITRSSTKRRAASELYAMFEHFARELNALVANIEVEFSPESWKLDSLLDTGPNIFQMNASGRVLQLAFEPAEPMVSMEHYRTPYTLEGAVRWFNQESLEGLGIHENLLFYCLEKKRNYWVRYDAQSHRKGPVDEDFLAGCFEQLL